MGKYVIFGVCFLAASVGSAVILTDGMVKFKKASAEVINVTGSAEKRITSDYAVWTAKVRVYLASKGMTDT